MFFLPLLVPRSCTISKSSKFAKPRRRPRTTLEFEQGSLVLSFEQRNFCRELEWIRFVCFWVFLSMVATKGHVCREPGQINYGQAPPFISTNMGSWRTPLNSNRDCFSVYPQFTAASCCIQRGPRSSKLMCTMRGKSKGGGCRLKYFSCTGSPP